jgi:UDP-N-acetylmuramoylalanine--D-glutamate ligase
VSLIKKVYCFGKDCDDFAQAACYITLDEVMHDIKRIMQSGDIVLFSPSGASFDYFENYKHRGKVFQELVFKLI